MGATIFVVVKVHRPETVSSQNCPLWCTQSPIVYCRVYLENYGHKADPVYKMKVFPSFCFLLAMTVTCMGVSALSPFECSCNGFINRNKFGECGAHGKGRSCFVNLPSSCTDLQESKTNPGMWYSAQPCREISASSCLENNVNYPGHDLRGLTNPSTRQNWQQCRDHCKRTSRCAEWTFRRADGQCWLKDPGYKGNRENEKGVISGSRNC